MHLIFPGLNLLFLIKYNNYSLKKCKKLDHFTIINKNNIK